MLLLLRYFQKAYDKSYCNAISDLCCFMIYIFCTPTVVSTSRLFLLSRMVWLHDYRILMAWMLGNKSHALYKTTFLNPLMAVKMNRDNRIVTKLK